MQAVDVLNPLDLTAALSTRHDLQLYHEASEHNYFHGLLIIYLSYFFSWVEEDPYEILNSVKVCLNKAVENLKELGINPKDIQGNYQLIACHLKVQT